MILNKIKKYKENKKGAMIIIMLAVIMMLSLPMIGVIYDYSMMRMAKQDLKNIQELAQYLQKRSLQRIPNKLFLIY